MPMDLSLKLNKISNNSYWDLLDLTKIKLLLGLHSAWH